METTANTPVFVAEIGRAQLIGASISTGVLGFLVHVRGAVIGSAGTRLSLVVDAGGTTRTFEYPFNAVKDESFDHSIFCLVEALARQQGGEAVTLPSELIAPDLRALFDDIVDWAYDEACGGEDVSAQRATEFVDALIGKHRVTMATALRSNTEHLSRNGTPAPRGRPTST